MIDAVNDRAERSCENRGSTIQISVVGKFAIAGPARIPPSHFPPSGKERVGRGREGDGGRPLSGRVSRYAGGGEIGAIATKPRDSWPAFDEIRLHLI